PPGEAGVASGLINTTQQVGGALGVAVLSTIAISVTTSFVATRGHSQQVALTGLTHGFSAAFWFGALLAAIGAVVALFGLVKSPPPSTEAVPAMALAHEEA